MRDALYAYILPLAQANEEVGDTDAAEEGMKVIVGMFIVGMIFIGVIALGELSRWLRHRRR